MALASAPSTAEAIAPSDPEAMAAIESKIALTSDMICEPRSMKNMTTSMIILQARTKAEAGLSMLSSQVMPAVMTRVATQSRMPLMTVSARLPSMSLM
jgi:hypothetical protein